MRILIAEDDPTSRFVLENIVEDLGHECLSAEDGLTAWETYQNSHDVEVVISDWMMPNLDGLGLCRLVRSLPRRRYTFFIILTTLSGKERLVEALIAGADEYLTKPLDSEQLEARLTVASRITRLRQHVGSEHGGEESASSGGKGAVKTPTVTGQPEMDDPGIWNYLVAQGRVSERILQSALNVQKNDPRGLGEIMVSLGSISSTDLAKAQAQRLGLSYVEIDVRDIDPSVLDLVPEEVLRSYRVMPLRLDNDRLFMATDDYTNIRALEELGRISGYTVIPVAASTENIENTLTRLYGVGGQISKILKAAEVDDTLGR